MQMRTLVTLLIAFFLALGVMNVAPAQVGSSSPTPAGGSFDLKPGEKVVDADGRTVENTSSAGNVKVTYTGNKSGSGQNIEVGKITLVKSPGSGGANKFKVETTGDATEIIVDNDGTARAPADVTVTGGNATITVNGDHTNFTVGGTGNTVVINGHDNAGSGAAGGASGGTVHLGPSSSGSSFNSNGGNWTTI